MEQLKREFSNIKQEIIKLKDDLKLKEEEIQTLKETLNFKTNKITDLKKTIIEKNEQIEELRRLIAQEEQQIGDLKNSLKNGDVVIEKEKKIKYLENKIEKMNEELEKTKKRMEEKESEEETTQEDIIDFTNIQIGYQEIMNKMNEILLNTLHSVNIIIPKITDLEKLSIDDIKSNLVVKISCFIDPNIKSHTEILEEIQFNDNISIRNYDRKDKFVILRDSEELLFSIIGEQESNPLTFYTQDSAHIKAITPMIMDIWLRSKKI
jgi:DNA repair exonuclease SbcCD ATPase subunit